MRLRDLFKKFRLAFPVFGILLGSCSGSLNLPTMHRKNAIPDGATSLSLGLGASSLYLGNPDLSSISVPGPVSNTFFVATFSDGTSFTMEGAYGSTYYYYSTVFVRTASHPAFREHCLNFDDLSLYNNFALFGVSANNLPTNSDVTLYFDLPFTLTSFNNSIYVACSNEVYVPSTDLYVAGYENGNSVGYSEGYASGYDLGNSVGYSDGYNDGFGYASTIPTVVTFSVPNNTPYTWSLVLSGGAQGTINLTSSNSSYSVICDPSYTDWYSWVCSIPSVSSGYYRYSYSDSLGNSLTLDPSYEDDITGRDLGLFLPYWVSWIKIECVYNASSGSWSYNDLPVFHYSRDVDDFELIKIGLSTQFYHAGYDAGFDSGFTQGYDSGYYDMSVIADSEIAQTSTEAYNDGRASVGTEENAITNLLGSIVSVPISVLNGLMPLAIWNTPIISILVTLMVVALVLWLVRVLI